MTFLQVVAEVHGRVGSITTFGTVVHLDTFMFPRMENVLPDVLSTVGSKEDKQIWSERKADPKIKDMRITREETQDKCLAMFLRKVYY